MRGGASTEARRTPRTPQRGAQRQRSRWALPGARRRASETETGQPLGLARFAFRVEVRVVRVRTSGEKGPDARRREHRSEAYAAYAAARSAAPTKQMGPYRRPPPRVSATHARTPPTA